MDPNNQPQSTNTPTPPQPEPPIPHTPTTPQPTFNPQTVQPVAPVTQPLPNEQQPIYGGAPQNTPSASGSSKKIIIIVSIIIGLLLVLPIVALLVITTISGVNKRQEADKKASTSQQSTTETQATSSQVPAGYVLLDKLCYSIQIPKDNDAGAENDCRFSARFGADRLVSMTVTQFTKYNEGLEANAIELKRIQLKTGSGPVVAEEDTKIGGLAAKKITFKGAGQYGLSTTHFLVATDKYKVDGVPIKGFEIIAPSYDKAENKAVIDPILASWQWK